MSFQIFLLVGHLTNWTGHNLLTDNTLKKRTQDVLVTCSVIVSDHNVKLAGHFQNLVGQCPMTDCYFQHRVYTNKAYKTDIFLQMIKFNINDYCLVWFQAKSLETEVINLRKEIELMKNQHKSLDRQRLKAIQVKVFFNIVVSNM